MVNHATVVGTIEGINALENQAVTLDLRLEETNLVRVEMTNGHWAELKNIISIGDIIGIRGKLYGVAPRFESVSFVAEKFSVIAEKENE